MSALQYKSKIKTPGVELGNEVVLTSPTTGRLNLGAKTETNHTRDNDVLTFDNLLKCSVELVGDGTGTEPSTMENLTILKKDIELKPATKYQNNSLRFVYNESTIEKAVINKAKKLRFGELEEEINNNFTVTISNNTVIIKKNIADPSWVNYLNYPRHCSCVVDIESTYIK